MTLQQQSIAIPMKAWIWTCKSCNSNFTILNHVMGNGEDFEGYYTQWGNNLYPPYCPSCGVRLPIEGVTT